MVIYDDMQTSEKVKVYDRGIAMAEAGDSKAVYERMISYRVGDRWAPAISVKEALLSEVETFVRCVDGGLRPVNDGESGLRGVEMLAAASESTRRRGQPIELRALEKAS